MISRLWGEELMVKFECVDKPYPWRATITAVGHRQALGCLMATSKSGLKRSTKRTIKRKRRLLKKQLKQAGIVHFVPPMDDNKS